MIRKVYSDLIRRKLREDGPGWLLQRGRQYFLLQLSRLLHRPLCGPALGTLMVTYRCNLHCSMCDMPLKAAANLRSGMQEYSTGQFIEIIRSFASMGVPGIGFTGGEPLLREDIFELLEETGRLGMISHLNTNGWLLDDDAADRITAIGVDSVNISLDGATAATHDRIRRLSGSFARAVQAVQRLTARKVPGRRPVRVKTVAVIDETNLDEVPEMIALAAELKTDCIEFIPRQPFAVAQHGEPGGGELLARVDSLVDWLARTRHPVPIENSPRHLRLFRPSFAGEPSPLRCSSGYTSLAVDCYGNLFPCVPWINWGKITGRLSDTTLPETWHSTAYQTEREKVSNCRDCTLNCQAELNLLFELSSRV